MDQKDPALSWGKSLLILGLSARFANFSRRLIKGTTMSRSLIQLTASLMQFAEATAVAITRIFRLGLLRGESWTHGSQLAGDGGVKASFPHQILTQP